MFGDVSAFRWYYQNAKKVPNTEIFQLWEISCYSINN